VFAEAIGHAESGIQGLLGFMAAYGIWELDPVMSRPLKPRLRRFSKVLISESAHGYCAHVGNGIKLPVNRCSAGRTK
jgi:hypothetical protein